MEIQSFFCPTKCTGKEAKTPVFNNKLHNEVATYSTSTTVSVYYEYYIWNLQYSINTYKNYLIYRQSEKRLHLKDKNLPFLSNRQVILL